MLLLMPSFFIVILIYWFCTRSRKISFCCFLTNNFLFSLFFIFYIFSFLFWDFLLFVHILKDPFKYSFFFFTFFLKNFFRIWTFLFICFFLKTFIYFFFKFFECQKDFFKDKEIVTVRRFLFSFFSNFGINFYIFSERI